MATERPFLPIERFNGYLPIEDHGLIGDGSTAALVGRDGAVSWLCAPRFDSPAVFGALLDRHRGGAFTIAPESMRASRQRYHDDSAVLVTEMRAQDGTVAVVDTLPLRQSADLTEDAPAGRSELMRRVRVLDGTVRLRIDVRPRGCRRVLPMGGGLELVCAPHLVIQLRLHSSVPLAGPSTTIALEQGDIIDLVLRWDGAAGRHRPRDPEQLIAGTDGAWRRWLSTFRYQGPQADAVRRSAITLKLLDHFRNGAIVAAPTSSLPERLGGVRNWDYRFAWIRDAAFTVYALRRIGLEHEAWGFLAWVLDAVERRGTPRVLYDLDGEDPPGERTDADLEGYRGSSPVRWGNDAAYQRQNDAYGEILDCAYQWARGGGHLDAPLWSRLRALADSAAEVWRVPDHGIWEVRTPGRLFTYSVALCHVAVDRAARLAAEFDLPGDVQRWRRAAHETREAILREAWDPTVGAFTEHLGGGNLDASLLALPLRRVVPADDEHMLATTDAIRRRLDAGDGLLYRYLPNESPDGLPGDEGAFLLCSFWLVDNLAHQGRLDEAADLYRSLCDRANPLGLLPEQIDPTTGAFLGNFPQALSHVGVISSGMNLGRLQAW
ncbi:MAG TPA: glycoside hydrolase family 15 protein [Nitriliruptorales bacterium]|nr:glycoside hydrolase family 15 protein [Nitriliruptorales bacterium]